ncbi:hypothetical protein HQQ94_13695 [Shewanella sp. VB17]|uniref:hypothetical protein n=1 Tax=Shewanella sp. VB17 TaxID=2739432 RepID=UPI00156786BF|nr:hypothetical protein [Shewanella sp. VB17]NRD74270.1 hypothetical protein [Shewanella sp. VB17]
MLDHFLCSNTSAVMCDAGTVFMWVECILKYSPSSPWSLSHFFDAPYDKNPQLTFHHVFDLNIKASSTIPIILAADIAPSLLRLISPFYIVNSTNRGVVIIAL